VAGLRPYAWRSADAEGPARPEPTAGVHERIRACGSRAAWVADQGVPGVVAMRYNVYVDTAARFFEDSTINQCNWRMAARLSLMTLIFANQF